MARRTSNKGAGKGKGKGKGKAKPRGASRRRSGMWMLLRLLVYTVVVGSACAAALGAAMVYIYSLDLPTIFDRDDYRPKQITRIYSADGYLIDEWVARDGRRTVVAFDAIAPQMRDAMVAAEDADFYRHQGLDYWGMARALYYAIRYDRRQGASTITQQVVKNLILTPEKKIKRKVQEIILARQLEKSLSKDDILYLYLNHIYFGHGNYGIYEASRFFFGKEPSKLSLEESALLAGVVQSPESLSPIKHPERALARRHYVLDQMWKKGLASEAEARAAMDTKIVLVDPKTRDPYLGVAPYYASHIRRLLGQRYPGQEVGAMGLRVKTALVVPKQLAAKEALHNGLHAFDKRKAKFRPRRRAKSKTLTKERAKTQSRVQREGLVAGIVYLGEVVTVGPHALTIDVGGRRGTLDLSAGSRPNPDGVRPAKLYKSGDLLDVTADTGAGASEPSFRFAPSAEGALVSIDVATRNVEAMVGGYDYATSSFNRATQARRQTGSVFKPFVYGAALEQGVTTPATLWLDGPKPFALPGGKTWNPKNSDGKYLGPITLRKALALSRNVVAVRLAERLSVPKVQNFARRAGIESSLVDNLTMALGSSELTLLEVTSAFSTLASLGLRGHPVFILGISDSFAQQLGSPEPARLEQTIPKEVAWLTANVMTSVLREGTAAKIGRRFDRPAAGKTGTTNKSRDAWFVGFTPQKVTGVWVGYDDNAAMGRGISGGSTAGPIWLEYMKVAHEGLPEKDFGPPPLGIVDAEIDRASGLLAADGAAHKRREFFLTGSAPTKVAPEADETTTGDFLLEQGDP